MTEILVFGNNEKVNQDIINFFTTKKSIIFHNKTIINTGNNYLVSFNKIIKNNNKTQGIIIYSSNFNFSNNLIVTNKYTAICESKNKKGLINIKKNNLNAVIVGYNGTETITFSSFDNYNPQIALQREIITLKNNIIEPFEFKSNLNYKSKTSQLLINTVKLLLELK